jgi:hypothetical protein
MKRLLTAGMMMGLLTAASAFADEPRPEPHPEPTEPTLTEKPACKGPQVDAALYGTYKAPAYGEQKAMQLTLEKNAATYQAEGGEAMKSKAWTCMKDGAMVLVVMKEPTKYMCQMITKGGDYMVTLGDVRADKTLEAGEVQSLMMEHPPMVYKKEAPSGGGSSSGGY